MNKKISIVTITKNNPQGLRLTLESVAAQCFRDYEHIIVDGGDDKESLDIEMNYKSSRSTCERSGDLGIYNAMNKGAALASGEYLLFLNAGDALADSYVLESAAKYLIGQEVVYGDLIQVKKSGEFFFPMPPIIDGVFLYDHSLAHPSTFIKRDFFWHNGGYDETYKIAGDHAFFIKSFLKRNIEYAHIPVAITKFATDGVSSEISNAPIISRERERALVSEISRDHLQLIKENVRFRNIHQKKVVQIIIKALFLANDIFKFIKKKIVG